MDYLDDKERERRIIMEERCAKLRAEIAIEREKERGLKMQEEQRRMQEERIRRQKELEKERKKREQLEAERKSYYTNLQKRFKEIGAEIMLERDGNDYMYTFVAKEDIELNKLFTILKQDDTFCRDGYIKDIAGNTLVCIDHIRDYDCLLLFEQEDERKHFSKGNVLKQAEDFLFCYLENRKIMRLENSLGTIILNGINQAPKLLAKGNSIEEKICSALESSNYGIDFRKEIESIKEKDMLVVNYELPNMSNFSEVKEYKYIASSKEIRTKTYTESYIAKRYENVLYSITLRSLYEIFSIDTENEINGITFNGFVTQVNPATGIIERKCILSLQVDRQKFSLINLSQVEPKACFKALKGVSAAKLVDISPITPILTFNKKDKRFVEGKDIEVNQGTNLAAMHWEDFEHLVRELFEMEFARNGGEVRVTQASRDGGVDAIVFDPDPLRGGKIVIQAKRYTNTVGVSAVRDLYGTVINEGANTGILITTSDYGHDSYEFAKDKPLKLLNGGHLLALLHKNGRTAHINIEAAKKINENKI